MIKNIESSMAAQMDKWDSDSLMKTLLREKFRKNLNGEEEFIEDWISGTIVNGMQAAAFFVNRPIRHGDGGMGDGLFD